ncbi:MAG: homocysteine S-methyltransferase family protein [Clostridia bacterium]|nr:homocysteine S-methyltransferase family protein [Clostridia bacterium]
MSHPVTLFDGASGTTLWSIAERNGVPKVPVWRYNLEHPEFVKEMSSAYIKAGSKIILANTFGANRLSVERASQMDPDEVVRAGVRLALECAAGTDVKVALNCGPLTELMEPYGDLEEDDVRDIYHRMFVAGVEAGAQAIVLETFIDLAMLRVATEDAVTFGVPVFCSLSFEKSGKTIMGNSVQDAVDQLVPLGVEAVGLNCSLGPVQALPIIEAFHKATDAHLFFKPNAGMPILKTNGESIAPVGPEQFAEDVSPALSYVSYIGGCCGTDYTYVEKLKEKLEQLA